MKVYKFKCKSCGATKYKKEDETTYKCLYCGNIEEVFLDKEKPEKSEIRKEFEELKDAFEEIIDSKKTEAIEKAQNERNNLEAQYKKKYKTSLINFIICLLGGWFGLHKFLDGKLLVGVIYLLTGGIFGIMYAFDCIVKLFRFVADYKKYLENKSN